MTLIDAEGSIAAQVWRFEPDLPTAKIDRTAVRECEEAPEAKALARELKRRGWRCVGPSTVYAFMQATGLVTDHIEGCAARRPSERARDAFKTRPVAERY
jgi:DNA-3-methyladenine glycosylase I